jgi:lantibiotic modifying enzyme
MLHDDLGAVQAMALEVARRLRDPGVLERAQRSAVQQSSCPEFVEWQPHSLARGHAGLAVLFEHIETCFPGQGFEHAARQHLEVAARALEVTPDLGISLTDGLSGVAFAASFLSRGGRRYRRLGAALDEALLPRIEASAAALEESKGGCSVHAFDLISGVTGAGVYLLGRAEHEGALRALERVLGALVALTSEDEGLPRWRTPPHLLIGQQISRFPEGNLNCGLAHGIPGPLALMSLAKLRGVSVPGVDESLERIAAWLLTHRTDDHRGVNWPFCHPLPRRGERQRPEEEPKPAMTGWCYGGPGIARALYLAGRALARPALCEVAESALRSAVTRPVEERGIPSPTFCHGVAGLLQITLRFARDTGAPVFERAARALLAELVDAYDPASTLGFRSVDHHGARVDDPGLLDGAAGICLALLTATTPAEPTWDRLLLLS